MSTEFRRFQMLHDTAANWTSNNTVLLLGELGVETDTSKFKIGDGTTAWNSLAYATGSSGTATSAFGTIAVSGQDNVVADSAPDTVTLVAGTNIAITTNAGADSVTIATSGLGTAATKDTGTGAGHVILGNDARLTDARTPSAHTTSHKHGGSDEIATATPSTNAIPKAALGLSTLAAGWIPDLSGTYAVTAKGVTNGDSHDHVGGDGAAIVEAALTLADNTTNNASTTKHGFCPKLSNVVTQFLNGQGGWTAPAGGSASNSFATIICPAGTDPEADSSTDILNLANGTAISITGDSSTDTVTIACSVGTASGTVAAGDDSRFSNMVCSVANLAALDDVDSTTYKTVVMRGYTTDGDTGAGIFDWNATNLATQCTADPLHGMYVPPNGETGSTGAWVRRREPGVIKPEWFGTSFTHAELQAAANMMTDYDIMILPPNQSWAIGASVVFDSWNYIRVRGDTRSEYYPKVYASTTSINGLFFFKGNGAKVSNITFTGTSTEISTNPTVYGTSKAIVFDRTSITDEEWGANIDGEVYDCAFVALHTGVYGKGRNVYIHHCIFSLGRYAIWGDVYYYDSLTLPSQFRGWDICDNRFHSMGTPYALQNDLVTETISIVTPINSDVVSWGGIIAQGVKVHDNHQDYCGSMFYYGTLHSTSIQNNFIYNQCQTAISCDGEGKAASGVVYINDNGVSMICNNNVDMMAAPGALSYWMQANHFLAINFVANLMINNNAVNKSARSIIWINCHKNLMICNNMFLNANISYDRAGVGDYPAIYIGDDSSPYDISHSTWIDGNKIWGGTYYDYGIYIWGREETVRAGINQIEPGRTGTIGNYASVTYGDPSFMYFDADPSGSYGNWGDLVLNPYHYDGKPNGQRTRINGHLQITGAFTLASMVTTTVATGTITEAQLEALNATPITVIDAPGAGKAIVVVGAQFFLDYNSAAYPIGSAGDLTLKYTDASGTVIATITSSGFLTAAADEMRYAIGPSNIEPVTNAVVVAHLLTGELTNTGNSPLKYRIEYKVIDTSW